MLNKTFFKFKKQNTYLEVIAKRKPTKLAAKKKYKSSKNQKKPFELCSTIYSSFDVKINYFEHLIIKHEKT